MGTLPPVTPAAVVEVPKKFLMWMKLVDPVAP